MAANQSYAIGWLVRRLEWERTLAELHAQVKLARESNDASGEPVDRAVTERAPRTRMRSPVRGMSRRRAARKIGNHGGAARSGVVVG